jgi:ribosomal protein S18 acetylase RimI-like enzyme
VDGSVNIRKALLDDVTPIAKLLGELFAIEDDFSVDVEKQIQGLELLLEIDNCRVLVAEISGQVIGMITMQSLISTAMGERVGLIEDVIVTHDFRGQGIGKQLLTTIIEESKQLGYTRLSLAADKRNERSIRFYQTFGFETSNMGVLYYLPRAP